MDSPAFKVVGEQPDLSGMRCASVVLEEYWHGGELVEAANVVWLRADSTWHRLCIDCGVVFWKLPDRDPEAYEMPELGGSVRLADLGRQLGFVGECFAAIEMRELPQGVEVIVQFSSGRAIKFRNQDDHTTYRVLPAHGD